MSGLWLWHAEMNWKPKKVMKRIEITKILCPHKLIEKPNLVDVAAHAHALSSPTGFHIPFLLFQILKRKNSTRYDILNKIYLR